MATAGAPSKRLLARKASDTSYVSWKVALSCARRRRAPFSFAIPRQTSLPMGGLVGGWSRFPRFRPATGSVPPRAFRWADAAASGGRSRHGRAGPSGAAQAGLAFDRPASSGRGAVGRQASEAKRQAAPALRLGFGHGGRPRLRPCALARSRKTRFLSGARGLLLDREPSCVAPGPFIFAKRVYLGYEQRESEARYGNAQNQDRSD